LTIANPSGVNLNIILDSTTSQQRLSFGTFIPANQRDFNVAAHLTQRGSFALFIFAGRSGRAVPSIHNIRDPSSTAITSRAPRNLINAELSYVNSDLIVNWRSSEATQPSITQIVFTQNFGRRV